ncbi:hypothetical protein H2200_009703 [Cladophialophora chaetospira]|uniref:Alcohol dehydrogenase-like N-terminal domain-containing protein n=1 Tax=Cladophialophora chaetospira TaxID=386627 RepID=A0AA39CF36_9EURO|nr:hypothetical protein H2200_009703 [Cladophialophora chaetospira]
MPPTNKALVLSTPKSPTQSILPAPYSHPSAGELVIKTHAVAMNPADWGIQRLGILIPESEYPIILGCDIAGEVVELPSGRDENASDENAWLKRFKIGDRVIGQTGPLFTKEAKDIDLSGDGLDVWKDKKIYAYAAFQEYVVLKGPLIARIPDNITYKDGAVLPLGIATAASCLFPPTMLNLDFPPADRKAAPNGKILLVWGASSSVGSCGVQIAMQAGYTVVGICSARNFGMVEGLGAVKCFDHNSASIVEDVVGYLKAEHEGKEVAGAYDGISTAPTLTSLCEILHRLSGTGIKTRKFIASVYPGAEAHAIHDVEIIVNLTQGMDQFYRIAGQARDWLEGAMQHGRVACAPEKDIVGNGLEAVQGAMDRLAEGKCQKFRQKSPKKNTGYNAFSTLSFPTSPMALPGAENITPTFNLRDDTERQNKVESFPVLNSSIAPMDFQRDTNDVRKSDTRNDTGGLEIFAIAS